MSCVSIARIIEALESEEFEPCSYLDEAIGRAVSVLAPAGPPPYTGSLDAARTLLLPQHSLNICQVGENDWLVVIFLRSPGVQAQRVRRWVGEARTAEVALCIAAMKARVDR